MNRILQFFKTVFLIFFLTLISQVGGLVYLLYKPIGWQIKRKVENPYLGFGIRTAVFFTLLFLFSALIVPPIAKQMGRVPLPVFQSDHLKPATKLTCLFNRHYAKPELAKIIREIAKEMHQKHAIDIIYLDANFPFFDGFPLLPHLSHNDGEKLDLSFVYRSKKSNAILARAPTLFGYGYVEEVQSGELNQPEVCASQGFWQYGLLARFSRQKTDFHFDTELNGALLKEISNHPGIGKIFIEPHLKQRLGLGRHKKIRFQGCHSVRHDDHIHLQL